MNDWNLREGNETVRSSVNQGTNSTTAHTTNRESSFASRYNDTEEGYRNSVIHDKDDHDDSFNLGQEPPELFQTKRGSDADRVMTMERGSVTEMMSTVMGDQQHDEHENGREGYPHHQQQQAYTHGYSHQQMPGRPS